MEEVSRKIKEIRIEMGLTLKDLSEKTDLSVSFLSQVERGASSIAITSLKKIADSLKVPITIFFEDFTTNNHLIKVEDQKPFQIQGTGNQYVRLGGEFLGRTIEPLLVKFPPGQLDDKKNSHPGEEFYYVLDGTLIVEIEEKEYVVKAGDSIHFPSNIPHTMTNPTNKDVSVLAVVTPVLF
ncbi:cupin domain-containing protein [Bacillus sp. FJAT-29937]|uniref:cupin domain-containing protein n=1 Tax=Bacillus sp. FJAT-29937 TaxID=1720553 RepID=UPI00082B2759|nr:cupin domain-containing protein [Bacillus sp. FJAT-29937]